MKKYALTKSAPTWAPQYVPEDFLKYATDTEQTLKVKNSGKALCYF